MRATLLCGLLGMAAAQMPFTTIVPPLTALPDCSKAFCPMRCQCAENHCAKEFTDCMSDKSCRQAEQCISTNCGCDDLICPQACGSLVTQPGVAINLANCVLNHCYSGSHSTHSSAQIAV